MHSEIWSTRGLQPFLIYGSVDTQKAAEALLEIANQIRALRGDRRIEGEELKHLKLGAASRLAGSELTLDGLAESLVTSAKLGLPPNYSQRAANALPQIGPEAIQAAVRLVLAPENGIWIVVGDKAKLEEEFAAASLGKLHVISE